MRIGIDLGGTKIECVGLGERGEGLYRKRIPTPRGDYMATLAVISALVEECERAARPTPAATEPGDPVPRSLPASGSATGGSLPGGSAEPATVGIGHPGAISPATGLIKNANSTWLNGRPLAQDLEARLARPIRFANDANCFALSEATDGAAAGARVVFGVIIGTGTGGGIVVDGRVLTGPNAVAGEWGHNPLPWPRTEELPGPPCYCGRSGCIETFLSGPGLVRDYEKEREAEPGLASFHVPEVDQADRSVHGSSLIPASTLTAAQIVALADAGEPRADAALARYVERMSRALASVINLLDPDVIVLGGGMSNCARLYKEVPRLWEPWVFSDRVDTRLVQAKFGDASGVRGAAWLWGEEL